MKTIKFEIVITKTRCIIMALFVALIASICVGLSANSKSEREISMLKNQVELQTRKIGELERTIRNGNQKYVDMSEKFVQLSEI